MTKMKRDDLVKQIQESAGQAPWSWLEPHFKANRLFVAVEDLSLMDVALAVAQDDENQVAEWLAKSLLFRPTFDQASHWATHGQVFEMLVVQPYVLAQLRTQA